MLIILLITNQLCHPKKIFLKLILKYHIKKHKRWENNLQGQTDPLHRVLQVDRKHPELHNLDLLERIGTKELEDLQQQIILKSN